jgi:hypothetical protein
LIVNGYSLTIKKKPFLSQTTPVIGDAGAGHRDSSTLRARHHHSGGIKKIDIKLKKKRQKKVAAHTFEGRETTVKDKLKIAKVSLAECEGRKLLSLSLELGLARQVTGEEVLEDTTMRSVGHCAVRVRGVFGRVDRKLKLQEPSRVESLGFVLTKQKPKSEHAIKGVNDCTNVIR